MWPPISYLCRSSKNMKMTLKSHNSLWIFFWKNNRLFWNNCRFHSYRKISVNFPLVNSWTTGKASLVNNFSWALNLKPLRSNSLQPSHQLEILRAHMQEERSGVWTKTIGNEKSQQLLMLFLCIIQKLIE